MSKLLSSPILLPLAALVIAIVGAVDAGYITYMELRGIVPPCSPGFQCETVLNSPWAKIGPVPLAALGLGFYLTMAVLATCLVLEHDEVVIGRWRVPIKGLMAGLGITGVLFSAWLVFLMGVIIKGWCFYCLISAGTSTLLGVVSVVMGREWLAFRALSESK